MQTKHTPAPWSHEEIGKGFRIFSDLDFSVAFIECGTIEKMEANAKLIAAAPELLDACITAMADTEMLLNDECELNDDSLRSTIEYLLRAIQKATL